MGGFLEAPVGQRLGASAKSTVGASFMSGRRVECCDAGEPWGEHVTADLELKTATERALKLAAAKNTASNESLQGSFGGTSRKRRPTKRQTPSATAKRDKQRRRKGSKEQGRD